MSTQALKPSDIRIGNFIYLTKDDFKTVKEYQIDAFDIYKLSEGDCADVKPIPLTEEWLFKLGFYESIENAGNLECYKKNSITIAKWISDKWQVWIDSKDLRKSPQYVHQLQNLFWCLTGEELEIKI